MSKSVLPVQLKEATRLQLWVLYCNFKESGHITAIFSLLWCHTALGWTESRLELRLALSHHPADACGGWSRTVHLITYYGVVLPRPENLTSRRHTRSWVAQLSPQMWWNASVTPFGQCWSFACESSLTDHMPSFWKEGLRYPLTSVKHTSYELVQEEYW